MTTSSDAKRALPAGHTAQAQQAGGVPPASPAHLGHLVLPKLAGCEVSPGVWLIGEPTAVPGSDKLRCLANVAGCLCLVELRIRFGASG